MFLFVGGVCVTDGDGVPWRLARLHVDREVAVHGFLWFFLVKQRAHQLHDEMSRFMAALQWHAAVSRWHPVELVRCDCHKNNDATVTVIDTRSLNKAKRHLHRHKVLSHNLHNITAHIDAIVTTINFYLSRLVHKCWEFAKFHCFRHALKKLSISRTEQKQTSLRVHWPHKLIPVYYMSWLYNGNSVQQSAQRCIDQNKV